MEKGKCAVYFHACNYTLPVRSATCQRTMWTHALWCDLKQVECQHASRGSAGLQGHVPGCWLGHFWNQRLSGMPFQGPRGLDGVHQGGNCQHARRIWASPPLASQGFLVAKAPKPRLGPGPATPVGQRRCQPWPTPCRDSTSEGGWLDLGPA